MCRACRCPSVPAQFFSRRWCRNGRLHIFAETLPCRAPPRRHPCPRVLSSPVLIARAQLRPPPAKFPKQRFPTWRQVLQMSGSRFLSRPSVFCQRASSCNPYSLHLMREIPMFLRLPSVPPGIPTCPTLETVKRYRFPLRTLGTFVP